MVMVNLGSTDDSRYTGYREITDRDVLDLQCIKVKQKNCVLSLYSYIMKTLLLVSLILSMMVYIGLKFFSAPSPNWGMAFKSRSQTFHTNVIFAYIIKTDFTGTCIW